MRLGEIEDTGDLGKQDSLAFHLLSRNLNRPPTLLSNGFSDTRNSADHHDMDQTPISQSRTETGRPHVQNMSVLPPSHNLFTGHLREAKARLRKGWAPANHSALDLPVLRHHPLC